MKKNVFTALLCLCSLTTWAQTADSTIFKGKIYNKEYDVYLDINFYENNVSVPGQEIFGLLPGYFGDRKDGRKWLITDVTIEGNTARLSIINDYGSEDLTATLTVGKDGIFTLKQEDGSTLKVARNKKWQKIPKRLDFVR